MINSSRMSASEEGCVPLRPLLPIELLSSSRHNMGIYLCVAVSARYQLAPSPSPSPLAKPGPRIEPNLLFPALKRVILSQPMLHVGILDEDTNHARFCHIRRVDLSRHVVFTTAACGTVAQLDEEIALRHARHHDEPFAHVDRRPAWRVEVVEARCGRRQEQGREEQEKEQEDKVLSGVQDIIFSYHHALLDGVSGRMFHEQLLVQLNKELRHSNGAPTTPTASPMLDIPPPANLPAPPAEIPFRISPSYFLKTLWTEFAPALVRRPPPAPWHGRPIDLSLPYISHTAPVTVPGPVLSKLLDACRRRQTTITALFHALTLAALAARLPEAEAPCFSAATPISLRPFLPPHHRSQSQAQAPTSPSSSSSSSSSSSTTTTTETKTKTPTLDQMLTVLVTTHIHRISRAQTAPFRPRQSPSSTAASPPLTLAIWSLARDLKRELAHRVSTLPRDDVTSLLKYVPDWFAYFRKKNGHARHESWEVSNIGVLATPREHEPAAAAPPATLTISRVYFSNGAMVVGPPLGLGLASVAGGGPLTVSLSWQEGVVSGGLMRGLAADLDGFMRCFDETGSFCP